MLNSISESADVSLDKQDYIKSSKTLKYQLDSLNIKDLPKFNEFFRWLKDKTNDEVKQRCKESNHLEMKETLLEIYLELIGKFSLDEEIESNSNDFLNYLLNKCLNNKALTRNLFEFKDKIEEKYFSVLKTKQLRESAIFHLLKSFEYLIDSRSGKYFTFQVIDYFQNIY